MLHFSQQAQARLAGENVTRLLGTSEYVLLYKELLAKWTSFKYFFHFIFTVLNCFSYCIYQHSWIVCTIANPFLILYRVSQIEMDEVNWLWQVSGLVISWYPWNYQSWYLSEPIYLIHFNARHSVDTIWWTNFQPNSVK